MRSHVLLTAALLLPACKEYADQSLTPAQKQKVEAHVLSTAPKPQHEIGAIIEDQVKLIGYDIDKTEVAPGETITVTYYIEALKEPLDDNMLFVHFQGRKDDRQAWMNLDHHPVEGLMPLRQLKKGQVVKDVQKITVKPDFPGGEAKIYWGLWKGNYRLKITNADKVPHDDAGRVVVATVKVKGDPNPKPGAGLPAAAAARLRDGETVTVDGKLDEPVWARATYTDWWTPPNGKGGDAPRTRARFAWNDGFVYVGVESEDTDVWSEFTDRDSNTWEQEVIEVFIDADGDRKDYLELQVTPANVVFDAKFTSHRSDLAAARAWNMAGLQTAAAVDGTLNQRDDQDRGYVVEIGIPVAEVPGAGHPPKNGDSWRVNLFRWDWPKDDKQKAAAFSPPVVGDFHALDRFGHLRFVSETPAPTTPGSIASEAPKGETR